MKAVFVALGLTGLMISVLLLRATSYETLREEDLDIDLLDKDLN